MEIVAPSLSLLPQKLVAFPMVTALDYMTPAAMAIHSIFAIFLRGLLILIVEVLSTNAMSVFMTGNVQAFYCATMEFVELHVDLIMTVLMDIHALLDIVSLSAKLILASCVFSHSIMSV